MKHCGGSSFDGFQGGLANLSGSLNAKNRDFARLSSPLGGQTPSRRPYRRIGARRFSKRTLPSDGFCGRAANAGSVRLSAFFQPLRFGGTMSEDLRAACLWPRPATSMSSRTNTKTLPCFPGGCASVLRSQSCTPNCSTNKGTTGSLGCRQCASRAVVRSAAS